MLHATLLRASAAAPGMLAAKKVGNAAVCKSGLAGRPMGPGTIG